MDHGVAVGGDYAKPNENTANIAITSNGGDRERYYRLRHLHG